MAATFDCSITERRTTVTSPQAEQQATEAPARVGSYFSLLTGSRLPLPCRPSDNQELTRTLGSSIFSPSQRCRQRQEPRQCLSLWIVFMGTGGRSSRLVAAELEQGLITIDQYLECQSSSQRQVYAIPLVRLPLTGGEEGKETHYKRRASRYLRGIAILYLLHHLP
ncbi:hypothetical protein GQ53DRAFT_747284 [Thozetella sp. PMI_491]|nr:hypothetical protein GQ53DRAFT_747284 [Thozetella sp. PMI_491]